MSGGVGEEGADAGGGGDEVGDGGVGFCEGGESGEGDAEGLAGFGWGEAHGGENWGGVEGAGVAGAAGADADAFLVEEEHHGGGFGAGDAEVGGVGGAWGGCAVDGDAVDEGGDLEFEVVAECGDGVGVGG